MLVRKQIMVPATVDKKIRRLARERGISQSALIVEAVEALRESSGQIDHLLTFAGVIKAQRRRYREPSMTSTGDARGPRRSLSPAESPRCDGRYSHRRSGRRHTGVIGNHPAKAAAELPHCRQVNGV